ncbi:lipase ROG1 family protein [Aspergillus tanneri]|uniref:DUF676 domain-containing protein n=1 Tax=Aspergillus tanneri TaxID=1220188 RepID=A0A5M9MTG8_9EURO|nr:uncharacterized protein ATNIH1004_005131 [Aspergillus tanneri]KAA8649236.1 hypothetical protein ATNIH1004_005131 [Aspergillus tanneri]
MLLIHQAGSVRVGEVVRYTLTYTPAADTICPTPKELYVKVKNTSAIPLRAAYLNGPYTLYTSCYPSTFDPNTKFIQRSAEEIPQFEPYLKAGGSWNAVISVPQYHQSNAIATVANSVTWIIEIISQVIFSSSASVSFELLVGRDKRSVELSSIRGASPAGSRPAQLCEHWSQQTKGKQVVASKGIYSRSITLMIDDTVSLWNSPLFPSRQGIGEAIRPSPNHSALDVESSSSVNNSLSPAQSNMLYLKESIDAAAREKGSRTDGTHQRYRKSNSSDYSSTDRTNSSFTDGSCKIENDDCGDGEQVIVRGFSGNAVRTERGIQYLGKRLANKTADAKACLKSFSNFQNYSGCDNLAELSDCKDHAYQITSISFIGHSLGGLIQTYAIAYIQKHYPGFFDIIMPVNFITLATPFLGLSNENPMYVKFALDLGLVGRTGQDLGLSWTAPRVRSGWEAIIGGKGDSANSQGQTGAGSKPLLRILPCGPAHEVLAKFQHRTVYSNVVNDGIVPLRTSCLLFLDWKGLDKVEKARRGNGIVGTMAEWGWAELTGANSNPPRTIRSLTELGQNNSSHKGKTSAVSMRAQHSTTYNTREASGGSQHLNKQRQTNLPDIETKSKEESINLFPNSSLSNIFSIFRPKEVTKASSMHKQTKVYKRSQTLPPNGVINRVSSSGLFSQGTVACDNAYEEYMPYAPPKTTFFESASDLLMPPLPPTDFIVDPDSRARTIFHDRIYHPEDIPPPSAVKRRNFTFSSSQNKLSRAQSPSDEAPINNENGPERGLKVEEKIARAYHRNLSWRKVLVRLEPDAHNNIIVRRMFTNAYGWPVVKHLVDTHFGCDPTPVHGDVSEEDIEAVDLGIQQVICEEEMKDQQSIVFSKE